MSRSPRIWPLALVIAVIALLWLWRDPGPQVRPVEPRADDRLVIAQDPAEASVDAQPRRDLVADAEPENAAPTEPDAAETPGPILRVRLRGLVAMAPWTTPLRIDVGGRGNTHVEHEARVAVGNDGTAEFPLPAWVAEVTFLKGRIDAEDPNYRELRHRFDGALDTSRELVLDVQPIAVLEGRVIDVRGQPVAAARVMAFALENGTAVEPQLGTTSTSPEGTYHIAVAPGVPLLLVTVPMQPMQLSGRRLTGRHGAIADLGIVRADLLPASCEVHGVLGSTTNVPDLVVADAARITGVVRWQGGEPIEKVKIGMANGVGSGVEISANASVGRGADGTLSLGATTFTDEGGEFELPARPGQRVELLVLSIPDTLQFSDVSATAVAPTRIEVAVPAPIRLRATLGGETKRGAILEHDRGGLMRGKDGELAVVLGSPIRVRARHGRLRSIWHLISPQLAGTTVELKLTDSLAEVAIEFHGDHPVRNATFRWRRDDGREGRESAKRDDRGDPFRLFLEPGHYKLTVGPAPGERNGLYLLPTEHEIDVGTTDMRLDLQAVFGGRFTVHATDASGRHIGGTCRLRDATGNDRTDRFAVTANDAGSATIGDRGELLPDGPNEFTSILAAGDYELEFAFEGHGTVRQRFTIESRQVTDLHVRLP